MKKLISLFVLMVLICTPCMAWFEETNTREATSVVVAADGTIHTGSGKLHSVLITSDGNTSGDRFDLFDGLSYSGTTKIFSVVLGATDEVVPWSPAVATSFGTGLYADLTLNGEVQVVVTYE